MSNKTSAPNEPPAFTFVHPETITDALKPLQSFLRSHFPKGKDAELWIDVGMPAMLLITFDADAIKATKMS